MRRARCGSGLSGRELGQVDQYAKLIGLAFQVVDDVLDADSSTATLGKTAGKDAKANKPTYVSAMGIARARELLAVSTPQDHNAEADAELPTPSHPCPCCGGRMITIEIFERGSTPRHRPTGPITAIRIDTS